MSLPDRLASYASHPRIESTDSRWETLLYDARAGRIRLLRADGAGFGFIAVIGA